MRREVEKGRYQMLWDCPFCGSEKLLGLDHKHCPACGGPQDPERRYYPPEGEEIAVEDHPYHGADRICPACSSPNAARAEFCGACGSPLDEAQAAARREDVTTAAGSAFAGETVDDAQAEAKAEAQADKARRMREASGQAPPPPEPPDGGGKGSGRGSGKGKLVLGCVVLLIIAAVLTCGVVTLWKKEAVVTVTGHQWERTIEVEEKKTVTDSAWKDDLPSGARNVSCSKEQRGTEKVQDGETCKTVRKDMGDGTYKKVKECEPTYKDSPTYDQKCRYTVEKWVTDRTERSAGDDTADKISWPGVKLGRGEREGDRRERYVVAFQDSKGEGRSCETSQARWKSLPEGSTWKAEVGVLSDAVDCDSLVAR